MFGNTQQLPPQPRPQVAQYAQQVGQAMASELQTTVNASPLRMQLLQAWSANSYNNDTFKFWLNLGLHYLDFLIHNRGYNAGNALSEVSKTMVVTACGAMASSNQNIWQTCPPHVQTDIQQKLAMWTQIQGSIAAFLQSMNQQSFGAGGWGMQTNGTFGSMGAMTGAVQQPNMTGGVINANANSGWGNLIQETAPQQQPHQHVSPSTAPTEKPKEVRPMNRFSDRYAGEKLATSAVLMAPVITIHRTQLQLTINANGLIEDIKTQEVPSVDYRLHETARIFKPTGNDRTVVPGDIVMGQIFDGVDSSGKAEVDAFIARMSEENEVQGDVKTPIPRIVHVPVIRPLLQPNTNDYHTQARLALAEDDRLAKLAQSDFSDLVVNYNIQNVRSWCLTDASMHKSHGQIKSWSNIKVFVESLRRHITTDLWSQFNKDLTDLTNDILQHYVCFGLKIGNFVDDLDEVMQFIVEDFGTEGLVLFEGMHTVVMNSLLHPLRFEYAFSQHGLPINTKHFLCFGKAYNITLLPAMNVDVPYGLIGNSGLVTQTLTPQLHKTLTALSKNKLANNLHHRVVTLEGDIMDFAMISEGICRLIKRAPFSNM